MNRSVRWVLMGMGLVAALVGGCRQNQTILVPNRVLDRPLDAVLACVRRSGSQVEILADNECNNPGSEAPCDADGENQLIGFVTNSEKNEVGLFRRCDTNGLVDLDEDAPGYNLLPVGTLPSRLVRTPNCQVVTANAGSCDFSAIDLPGLAGYALELDSAQSPSSLQSRIIPLRGDGTPLGAAPGDMVAVPSGLSLAGATDTGESTGATAVCDPLAPASIYVTFPACQLVAEIDLSTQRIVQSRQFVRDGDGDVTVIDPGPDPQCPVECPEQFDGDLPTNVTADAQGVFPVALALVAPGPDVDEGDPLSEATRSPRLFVGGSGVDEIYDIAISLDPNSRASMGFVPPDQTQRLTLEAAAGVANLRVTPAMFLDGEVHQFLYAVAGDGSTRVIDRSLDGTSLGIECDTQVDPALAVSRACHPLDPNSQASLDARRPFAAGPGIRTRDGSVVTDWAFQTVSDGTAGSRSPFAGPGVVGIGVTSFGRIVLSVFGQFDDALPTVPTSIDGTAIDPIGLLNVEVRPHMLWPLIDPQSGDPSIMPLVADEAPRRGLPSERQPTAVLAPSLRQIDLAYFANDSGDFSAVQTAIWQALGRPANVDGLGGLDDEGLYSKPVPRIAVRDYSQWLGGQTWSMVWEPGIPGTESFTGRLECDDPSPYGGGSCHVNPGVPDGVRIVDEGATFCDAGVLPGDRFFIFGCTDDSDCGLGQRCLRDPSAGGNSSGICVSEGAYETQLTQLRQVCGPFISDPCGAPRREYVVTSAAQTRLSIAAVDIPESSFLRHQCPVATGSDNLRSDSSQREPDEETADRHECHARLTCRVPEGVEPPISGCAEDQECEGLGGDTGAQYVCIDGRCRTPCEGGSFNCRQNVLPGPGCFAEFIHYGLGLRDAFGVSVAPSAPFLSDRVVADPDTGECYEDPTVSTLLTSRIPLGRDQAAVLAQVPLCPNADEATPLDPNPCLISQSRAEDPAALYHLWSYDGQPVVALRFSNPFGTMVLDLVSLPDLAAPTDVIRDDNADVPWPDAFVEFHRSRIPRGYREEFATPQAVGYQTYNDPIVVASTPLTYPVRVIPAPELGVAYVVDAGGRGGAVGIRGQVVRITVGNGRILGDDDFRVQ